MSRSRTEVRTASGRGYVISATWEFGDDDRPTSESPRRVEIESSTDRGVTPAALMFYREHLSGWVSDVHGLPDKAEARKSAMKYLIDHLDDLTPKSRAEVNEDYYNALDAAMKHITGLGLSDADALQLIATSTGDNHGTVRTRYYKGLRSSERRERQSGLR